MLYLPRGVYLFLEQVAYKKGKNIGQFLVEIVVDHAKELGFECKHPLSYQIIDKEKTKLANLESTDKFKRITVMRCKWCGHTWEKR